MELFCPICKLKKTKPQNKYCSIPCRNIYINSLKDYSKQSKKVGDSVRLAATTKNGELLDFTVSCRACNIFFTVIEREKKFPMKDKYFCSSKCSNTRPLRSAESMEKLKLKLLKEPYSRLCKYCNSSFITKRKSKTACILSCYTNYKRKLNFSRKSIKSLYRQATIFRFSLNSYPTEFNFKLIEENGWYSAKNHGNNLNGISRDHLFSVAEGFNKMINPLILAHPANCDLKIHTQNILKNSKCSIELDQLINKINDWNIKYSETFLIDKVFINEDELKEILLAI